MFVQQPGGFGRIHAGTPTDGHKTLEFTFARERNRFFKRYIGWLDTGMIE